MEHRLEQLVIYSDLAADPILLDYQSLLLTTKDKKRKKIYFELVRKLLNQGKSLRGHLYEMMLASGGKQLERLSHESSEATELDYACLKNDLTIINHMIHFDALEKIESVEDPHNLMNHLIAEDGGSEIISAYDGFFESINDKPIFHEQCDVYIQLLRQFGTGRYAGHFAFFLNHDEVLVPIERYEPLDWAHIYDYRVQKNSLLENTRALAFGKPFHHALLVGASGTGKSSSVKAVTQLFKEDKLRLIQLYKGQLRHLPKLLESLSRSIFKFVIFIDDLSFEVNEDEYKFLKSFIEGGIANEASNVAFYVTSNRRHLIKEMRSERESDIHMQDFIQEMTSLSGRFGLNLTFAGLEQPAYYEMVGQMLTDEGIVMDEETMQVEARRWSIRHGGMSGRVANQFVRHKLMTGK